MLAAIEIDLKYHHWANTKLLEHINQLKNDVFLKEVKSVFPSLAAVFEHIYQVDLLWLQRILGEEQPAFEEVQFETPLIAIEYFERNQQKIKQLSSIEGTIRYKNTKGETFQNDVHEIVRHIINHGTYHRGNAASVLRQIGEKGISTDYIYFIRELKGQ